MFDSLDEQMKHDDQAVSTPKERVIFWVSISLISVLVFGGLYVGIRMLEG